MLCDNHGEIRGYDDMHGILRRVAELRNISREAIDELAGLPKGYAGKILSEVPLRRLGPDTLGPMLGAIGVKLIAVDDPEAMRKYTARAETREVKTAFHSTAVHFKISLRKLKQRGRKGGKNSRKFVGKRKARKLARRGSWARWKKPKLVEITKGQVSADGYPACRWTPAIARSIQRAQQSGLFQHSRTKYALADETRELSSQPR